MFISSHILVLSFSVLQQYFENRLKYLATQKADGLNPYPHKFPVSMSITEYIEKYGGLTNGEHLEDDTVFLAGISATSFSFLAFLASSLHLHSVGFSPGRIMSKRSSSSKLYFYDMHGEGAKVQVMADAR